MTLEQYMRELWLMDKQYGQEEELYPLINMLLRDGVNTENLSIRDVHKSQRIKADNNKNVKSRKYIDGFGSFPDLAIFDESFPDLSDEENIVIFPLMRDFSQMLSNGVPEAVPGAPAGLHRDEWLFPASLHPDF